MLGMCNAATHSNSLDELLAALQSGICDEDTAQRLYQLGPQAVTLALLSAARRINEQNSRLAELQAQTGTVSPSTPPACGRSTPSPTPPANGPRPANAVKSPAPASAIPVIAGPRRPASIGVRNIASRFARAAAENCNAATAAARG
jgi:hypothetical protein